MKREGFLISPVILVVLFIISQHLSMPRFSLQGYMPPAQILSTPTPTLENETAEAPPTETPGPPLESLPRQHNLGLILAAALLVVIVLLGVLLFSRHTE